MSNPVVAATQRLGHGGRVVARLTGLEGVAALPGDGDAAAAEPTLAQALEDGPLDTGTLLELASRMALTLAAIHARGVLHRNIQPASIVVRQPHGALLTGFELASTFAEERPGFVHHREIRGNLAYMAPELTGRSGRGVDLRADLYALGATLYAAATGRPPFESSDPLQLLHDHTARLPAAPARLRAGLPAGFSDIVLRLLEKEPERRYQSGDGLAHDLARVREAFARGDTAPLALGENDFPLQLSPPARLVGREAEIASLRQALDEAVRGGRRLVLVTGPAGVGKTSLINELRPLVTERGGWFVAGKFSQYHRDGPGAANQAFRALGRLLLAEPERELAALREAILRRVGANAGLFCTLPEFALLLGPQPDVPHAEPAQAESRLVAAAVNLLRAIASTARPLVMFLDDVQWAGALQVRLVEAVAAAPELPGLLLVGSCRDGEVDAANPAAKLLAAPGARRIAIGNLPAHGIGEMLREMMRLPPDEAAPLADAIAEHTAGNPYDTIELLNTWRREGALVRGPAGWKWDPLVLRRHVGAGGVLDLLSARIARLPAAGRELMHAIAFLGGHVPEPLLLAATAMPAGGLEPQLLTLVEEGLVAIERGAALSVRMRHDRVQQAVYGALSPRERHAEHLALARRLSAAGEHRTAAARQYLAAVDAIEEPGECRAAARLMHDVATRMRAGANFAAAHALLAGVLGLLARLPGRDATDEALCAAAEVNAHVVLCSLGRYEEADARFGAIEARGAPVEDWVDAACAQVDSINNRSRPRDAIALGLGLLARMGADVPPDFAVLDLEQRLAQFAQWVRGVEAGVDARPYTGDRQTTARARLMHRLSYPAYFANVRVLGWIKMEAHALWCRWGPSPDIGLAVAGMGSVSGVLTPDYRSGYEGSRHVLGVLESRGWEPGTSTARLLFAVHSIHWFEPLEASLRHLRLARAGAEHLGEVQSACFTYRPSTTALMDCSPTVQGWLEEVEAGLAYATRIRNEYVVAMMTIERELVASLRGEPAPPDAPGAEGQACVRRQAHVPAVRLSAEFARAFLAALFGDMEALAAHVAKAMEHVPLLASYRVWQVRMLDALAQAHGVRCAAPPERASLLARLDAACEWLERRGADAPGNFAPGAAWMRAERAWAAGDFQGAATSFDAALCAAQQVTRPWHHALVAERAAAFHLAHGMNAAGRALLREARDRYRAWGAEAKVRQLHGAHAFLAERGFEPDGGAASREGPVDTLDTLAILRASQALSSETSLARLKARIGDVMRALAGATDVQFALWDEAGRDWVLAEGAGPQADRTDALEAARQGRLPLAALRYAERTREPLVVDDAAGDDRFLRDPYMAALGHGSLLVVPILGHGSLRAMLLLENRLARGAFTASRLDAVSLIAGQLAVSLQNALLYDGLERRVREQTRELLTAARRSGMAQVATNVLHNVGNVLNSVNTSAHMIRAQVAQSRGARLAEVADLLEDNAADLGPFFAAEGRGRLVPRYLRELAQALAGEREQLLMELKRLDASVEHIKNVVAMQQSYAGAGGVLEPVSIADLVEDALLIHQQALERNGVTVARDYAGAQAVPLDRSRVMQILVNLVDNARHAMEGAAGARVLRLAVRQDEAAVSVEVGDTGCGIAPADLAHMFSHGFTTKVGGHGFGLHSCAVAAREMGGTLSVHSEGVGRGAAFRLELPLGSPPPPAEASA